MLALGVWASRRRETADGFFVADRSMPWWAVGLSVMATQASAITVIGTTGTAYADGMGFWQFYLGLPVAMVVLAYTLLPMYRRAGVTTAYELLGQRFDGRVRLLTSVLFMISRGLALGVVLYAPSVVLSLLLDWSQPVTVLVIAAVAMAYTTLGGLRAVIVTDVLQMLLVFAGLGLCLWRMLARLPADMGLGDAWELASLDGRTQLVDWSFDPSNKYTIWSGLLGGTFLFLAYFGCDQSQVQRLLASKSLGHARRALALNAVAKIPVQLAVLLLGVVLFVVHAWDPPAPLADLRGLQSLEDAGMSEPYDDLVSRWEVAQAQRAEAGAAVLARPAHDRAASAAAWVAASDRVRALRAEARELVERARTTTVAGVVVPGHYDDKNHVFPADLIRSLPMGLVGLLIAVVFAAAMSSIDSELNALATSFVVDVWRPMRGGDEAGQLRVTRLATLGWGALASLFALYAAQLGSVVEAVNTVGSYFYGSLLGVFVLAFGVRRADARGAFWGLLAGMATVAAASTLELAWLWLNPIGCAAVVVVGLLLSREGTADADPVSQ